MKKAFLSFASSILSAGALFAQPTLTATNSAPAVGTKLLYSAYEIFAPGTSGPAQSWDFTSQWPAGSQTRNTLNYVDCNSLPNCALHPGTTVVANDTFLGYSYYNITPTSMSLIGTKNFNNADLMMDDPEQIRSFPCSFGTTFTDSFSYRYQASGGPTIATYSRGQNTVVADGWGTLTTPAGTYNNTLRLHTTEYSQDSVVSNGTSIVYTNELNVYSWYDTTHREALYQAQSFVTSRTSSVSNISRYMRFIPTAITPTHKVLTGVSLWPNPATSVVKIEFSLSERVPVTVKMTDVMGKTVKEVSPSIRSAGRSSVELSVSDLAPGLYMLQMAAEGNSSYHKVVVSH